MKKKQQSFLKSEEKPSIGNHFAEEHELAAKVANRNALGCVAY